MSKNMVPEPSRSTPPEGSAQPHTPGPWEIEPGVNRSAWIRGSSTQEWAALACGDTDAAAAANARLIAAAPEMLAALRAIADESVFNQQRFAEDTDADYFLRCFKAVKERARAAIAKAESRS